jgi:hypothetical protein
MTTGTLDVTPAQTRPAWLTVADEAGRARAIRWWLLALIALAALGLAVGVAIIDAAPVGVFADDAFYVILARSIATGQGLSNLNLPGAPAATHFPPGYPAVLALLWRMAPAFPANLIVFKAFNAVCLAAIAVGTARFMRLRVSGPRLAIATGVVTAVSLPLLILGNMLLSELFFLALLMFLLPELERLAERRTSPERLVALGAAIGVCTLIRTHGIVLLPATVAVLIVRRRWRDVAVISAVTMLCLLPWQLWSAKHGGVVPAPLLGEYDSYTGWWMQGYRTLGPRILSLTVAKTFDESLGMFAVLFSPVRGRIAHAATLTLMAATVVAAVRADRRRLPVTLLFLACYLIIVLFWPGAPSRFLWGIWPLFLILLAEGARAELMPARIAPAARRFVAVAAVAWLAVGYAAYEARGIRGQWWSSIARAGTGRIASAVQWTLTNTAPTDIVAADDDGAVFLYSGRRTVPARSFTAVQYLTGQPSSAAEGLVPILAAYPVRAVVVGTGGSYQAAASLALPPRPRLSMPQEYPGGAAFTVLSR